MKYIKKFENTEEFTYKYKIGDYVLLNVKNIEFNNKMYLHEDVIYDDCGLIEEVNIEETYPYVISFYNGAIISLNENEIVRTLTEEEIERFKLKKETEKYNL